MANVDTPSVSAILRTIWNDLGQVLVRLRRPSIIGLVIVVLFDIVGVIPEISGNRLLSEAFNLLRTIAMLPLEIAIFRLLILDEIEPGYPFAISTTRFRRMLGWSVALWVLAAVPGYLLEAPGVAMISAGVMITVISIVIVIRLSLLLPAIAVDAPGASVGNAMADTKGHAWMIVKPYLTVALILILIFLAAAALASLTGLGGASGSPRRASVAAGVFAGVIGVLALCASTIIAARLFMSLGERLKGAAIVPHERAAI